MEARTVQKAVAMRFSFMICTLHLQWILKSLPDKMEGFCGRKKKIKSCQNEFFYSQCEITMYKNNHYYFKGKIEK